MPLGHEQGKDRDAKLESYELFHVTFSSHGQQPSIILDLFEFFLQEFVDSVTFMAHNHLVEVLFGLVFNFPSKQSKSVRRKQDLPFVDANIITS